MQPQDHPPTPPDGPGANRRLKRRRWLAAAAVATVAAVAIVAQGARRTPADPVEPLVLEETDKLASLEKAATLRVATFNIHAGVGNDGVRDLSRTADALADLDVAALQEVRSPLGGGAPQVRDVARTLGLAWLFVPAERRWWHSDYGSALLTRTPLIDSIRIPLPTPHRQRFRAAVLANFRFQGQTVHLLAVHIDRDLEKQTHDQQLRTAFDLFSSLREPAILMGDLNDVATHPEFARLLETPGVRDALAGVPPTVEHPTPIDWIITRGFQTVRGQWRDGPASDHPAAWAELELIPKIAARQHASEGRANAPAARPDASKRGGNTVENPGASPRPMTPIPQAQPIAQRS